MDLASILGLVVGLVMVVFGIASGDKGIAALGDFIEKSSIIITIGGSLSSILSSCSLKEFIGGFSSIRLIFKVPQLNQGEVIKNIIDLSNVARKEGLLALEEAANNIEDPFMKKGILLIVDGTDPELIRNILETELTYIETRHKKVIGFWETWSSLGPAWGMIGTLIGLVNMLQKLEDVAAIGPNMAVALLTTLYGSLIANWLCNPISSKLKANSAGEIMVKEVMVEGLLSIQAGENPRVIEEKLKSFLSPAQREEISSDEGTAGGEA